MKFEMPRMIAQTGAKSSKRANLKEYYAQYDYAKEAQNQAKGQT